jgi:hypothetical protein
MGLFSEEESKGSPLFAAALGAGAIGAGPAVEAISKKMLAPSLVDTNMKMLRDGHLSVGDKEVVDALKEQLIDKNIRNKLHVFPHKGPSSFAQLINKKKWLPDRREVEKILESGKGMKTYSGNINPIKAIHDIKDAGGFIRLNNLDANAATLAHELGHATSLNRGAVIRASKPYRLLDHLGRRMSYSSPKSAMIAALLAGSFNSDDNKKWLVPGAIAATQAPLLFEEAQASVKGLGALNSLKDKVLPGVVEVIGESGTSKLIPPSVQNNARKYLAKAFGTYALPAAGLLAAPLLAIAARNQFDKLTD